MRTVRTCLSLICCLGVVTGLAAGCSPEPSRHVNLVLLTSSPRDHIGKWEISLRVVSVSAPETVRGWNPNDVSQQSQVTVRDEDGNQDSFAIPQKDYEEFKRLEGKTTMFTITIAESPVYESHSVLDQYRLAYETEGAFKAWAVYIQRSGKPLVIPR